MTASKQRTVCPVKAWLGNSCGNIAGKHSQFKTTRAGNMMARKQILVYGNKRIVFTSGLQDSFPSRTHILLPKHMIPSLATTLY